MRPNRAFAEVFLIAVLGVTKDKQVRNVHQAVLHLRGQPADRLAAAEAALVDFRHAGVDMSTLCSLLAGGLQELKA